MLDRFLLWIALTASFIVILNNGFPQWAQAIILIIMGYTLIQLDTEKIKSVMWKRMATDLLEESRTRRDSRGRFIKK